MRKLEFPLYHGTSTIFLDSILRHGLGAFNPLIDLKVLPLLEYIYPLWNKAFESDSNRQAAKFCIEWILGQVVTEGGANFRHGGTYLTPSKKSAVSYALKNRFGSELLSYTLNLYQDLVSCKPEISQDPKLKEFPSIYFLESKALPILIEIQGIEIDRLRSETGEGVEKNIESIRNYSEIGINLEDEILNFNFELIQAVSPKILKVYEIILIAEDEFFPNCKFEQIHPPI